MCFHSLEWVVLKKDKFPLKGKKISLYHLVAGGPHHPGQSVEQVLPLQKLQPKTTHIRQHIYKCDYKAHLHGKNVTTSETPWAESACPRSTPAPSTTGCRCARFPDSASRCSQVLYSYRRHLSNTYLKTELTHCITLYYSILHCYYRLITPDTERRKDERNSPTRAKLLSRSSLWELNQAWARRLFLFLPMM